MPAFVPGAKYHIINAKSETLLDLSGTDPDHAKVIGWPANGGDNQKWYIEKIGDGLVLLKNVLYGKYVGFAGELRPGAPAVGLPHKREWALQREEEEGLFRFFTPDSELNLELSHHGSDKGGTPVVLALRENEKYQIWRIEEIVE